MTAQAAFNLDHQVHRKTHVTQGLCKGFDGVLRLATISCEARMRSAMAVLSGFGLFFGVSLR